jgi:hypothetical protein
MNFIILSDNDGTYTCRLVAKFTIFKAFSLVNSGVQTRFYTLIPF